MPPRALVAWAFMFFALPLSLAFSLETDLKKPVASQDDLDDLLAEGAIGEEEYDRLSYLLAHPIDINSAGIDEFYSLPSIDRLEASQIVNLRDRSPFRSVEGLRPLIGRVELELVKPFVKVSPPDSQISGTNKFKAYLSGPPDLAGGYDYNLFDQIDLAYRNLFAAGYLTEYSPEFNPDKVRFSDRDKALILQPKEPIWQNGHRWYLGLKDMNLLPDLVLRRAILGDYGLKFGQGLTFNEGGITKENIRFNSSSSEYLLGIASQVEWEVLKFTAFYSNDDYNAVGEAVVEGSKRTLTIPRIYHEDTYGANASIGLDYWGGRLQLGSTYFHSSVLPRIRGYTIIGYPIGPDGLNLSQFDCVGADFSFDRREGEADYSVAGELAWLINGGIASILRGSIDLGTWRVKSTFLQLASDYFNPHNNPSVGPVRSAVLTPEGKELRVSARRGYTFGSVEARYDVVETLSLDGRYSLWRFAADEIFGLERGLTQSELKLGLGYRPLDSVEIKASNRLTDRDMAGESQVADPNFSPLEGEFQLRLTLTPQDGTDLSFTYTEGYSHFSLTTPQTDDSGHATFRSYSPQLKLDLPYNIKLRFNYTLRESLGGVSGSEDLGEPKPENYQVADKIKLGIDWRPYEFFQVVLGYDFSASDVYGNYTPLGDYSLQITTNF